MILRATELNLLEKLYSKTGNQLVMVYGRDASEYEGIIAPFLKDKKYFYFRASSASPKSLYERMAAEVSKKYDVKLTRGNYREVFNRVKSGDSSKLVVVIDESQYFKKGNEEFWDAIIQLKTKKLYPGPVMILLYSSSVLFGSTGIDECLGENVKRLDEKIKLLPHNFLSIVRYFQNLSVFELVSLYGTLGGTSSHVIRWNPKKDVKANITGLMLSPLGALYEKADKIIGDSLRETAVYETILGAIAAGNRKLNDLYHLTGFSRAKISVYLKNLAELDLIEKVESLETGGVENTQKGLYQIKDTYSNFYFRFIYPYKSDLFLLTPDEFYDKHIGPFLDEYLEKYFIKVCMEYITLLDKSGKLPLKIKRKGTWVGKQGTIDILVADEARNMLAGMCNMKKDPIGMDCVKTLEFVSKKAKIKPVASYLFSSSGFTDEIVEFAAANKNYILVDMKQL